MVKMSKQTGCILMFGLFVIASSPPISAQVAASNDQKIQQEVIAKEKELRRKIRLWNWCLSQIARREKATMFVDVSLDSVPPNIAYDRPYGIATMKALARTMERVWKQPGGVQTFSRSGVQKGSEQIAAALNWLSTLPPNRFSDLVDGTLVLGQLDEHAQDLLKDLAGWEPDMNFVLLGKTNSTQLKLAVRPRIEFQDPKTGAKKSIEIPCRPERAPVAPKLKAVPNQTNDYQALDAPDPGKLDFQSGMLLTLEEIVRRAEEAFKVSYVVDGRMAENRYFVSGSYSETAFERSLGEVTTVPPVHLKQGARPDRSSDLAFLRARLKEETNEKLDVTRLRDDIRKRGSTDIDLLNQQYGDKEQLDTADFLEGKTVKASDFSQGKPGLSSFFQNQGIGPDALLTLGADFALAIQSDGTHQMSNGYGEIDGQPVSESVPNETLIGLP